jgi:hypothetical protein
MQTGYQLLQGGIFEHDAKTESARHRSAQCPGIARFHQILMSQSRRTHGNFQVGRAGQDDGDRLRMQARRLR